MGFADCKEVAITCSGTIPNSEVYYGLYTPLTPQNTWDKRWEHAGTFTHFWVEHDGKIIDRAADQFGGPPEQITRQSDLRYVKVGKYDKLTDKTIPLVSDPKIEWDTLTGPGGKVVVYWEGYDRYLMQLEGSK